MFGGAGNDFLSGGAGNDVFRYTSLDESTTTSKDFIGGFTQGEDVIDLATLGFTVIQTGAASGTILGYTHNGGDTHITADTSNFEIEIGGNLTRDRSRLYILLNPNNGSYIVRTVFHYLHLFL